MAKVSLGVNFVSLLRLNFLSYYTCYLISLDFITHETAPLHYFPAKKNINHHYEGRSFCRDGIKKKENTRQFHSFSIRNSLLVIIPFN